MGKRGIDEPRPKREDYERPKMRRFLPTIPEIIAEIQDEQSDWSRWHKQIKDLQALRESTWQRGDQLIAELRNVD